MNNAWSSSIRAGVVSVFLAITASGALANETCGAPGLWVDPANTNPRVGTDLFDAMATRPAVLLGESHDQAEDHRWQLHTLAALHGRQPALAVGLEMLPRTAQPVLDDWVAGKLTVEQLLERSRWSEVWGFDPELYLPVFHFARQNRVPMIALNVDRGLIARVGTEGWLAVPVDSREGVGDPAPAPAGYLDMLAQVYVVKARMTSGDTPSFEPPTPEERREIDADPGFGHFVEAQLTWDRAMAEAIAARLNWPDRSVRLVVSLVGRGHAEYGYGIPHQLADLGIADAGVLLTARPPCDEVDAGVADAVFGLGEWQEPDSQGPRLGVMVASGVAGVLVQSVSSSSVAEATGLAEGDVIVEAAGTPVAATGELISIIQRQAPGTWLPLVVQRDSERIDLVAKFPTAF